MRGLDDLVSQGKVLYVGISDAPAWWVAQANALAELRGWSQFIGSQMIFSDFEVFKTHSPFSIAGILKEFAAGRLRHVRALRSETTVKGQGLSCVIRRSFRKQPYNCIGDLLRASNPANGMHRTHFVECLFGAKYVEQHLSPNRTRTHCVHPNTISPAFDRRSLGQAEHSVFAGHVGGGGWKC
jgi:hypothetical protein